VVVLGGLFLILGLIALPLPEYLWRLAQLVLVLVVGIVLNATGAVGAGDAKFAAAAAPYVALGDLRLLVVILMANLLAAVATHRLARHTPLRRLAPHWESWSKGWEFPMGLSLGGTLAIYLILGALMGS
jgi:prepilin peptidase CpaA